MAKDYSQRRKHFTTKNPFPFADIERIDSAERLSKEGILLLRTKNDSDTERRTIRDSMAILPYDEFRQDIIDDVGGATGAVIAYNTIADRNADPASSSPLQLSFVRNASDDTVVGRNIWAFYIYDSGYVLVATEEDVIYSTDVPDASTAVATAGTIIAGQTTAGSLKGQTFSKFMDQMLFVSNPTKTDNSAGLIIVPSGTIEDGTPVGIVMNATYNRGIIQSADGSPDVPLTGLPSSYDFSNSRGYANTVVSSALAQSDTATTFDIGVETVTSTVVVNYDGESSDYFDGNGNRSTIFDGDRGPGSITANAVLVGRRFAFYEGNDASFPTNSPQIRAGQNTFLSAADTGSFTVTINDPNVNGWFAVPEGNTVTVLYRESSNADITSAFDVTVIAVSTGGGVGPTVDYELWTERPRAAYGVTANYDVTIT